MLMHPVRQSPIVAAGPAPRKSLERDHQRIDLLYAEEAPASASPELAGDEIVGRTGQWCERNSVALLEACCNRDIAKGVSWEWSFQLGAPCIAARLFFDDRVLVLPMCRFDFVRVEVRGWSAGGLRVRRHS